MRRLWLQVIKQAVDEAEGLRIFVGQGEDQVPEASVAGVQRRARKWLSTCSPSLRHVASLAGLSGEQVKLLVETYKERYKDGSTSGRED